MMNQFNLVGHIGQIRSRKSESGTTIANVSIATNRSRKVNEEWVEETDWHQVTIFGKRAETIEKHCEPGMLAVVNGELRPRKYEKDGQTVYTIDLVSNRFDWKKK